MKKIITLFTVFAFMFSIAVAQEAPKKEKAAPAKKEAKAAKTEKQETKSSAPLKKDGTPDKRFKKNKEAAPVAPTK